MIKWWILKWGKGSIWQDMDKESTKSTFHEENDFKWKFKNIKEVKCLNYLEHNILMKKPVATVSTFTTAEKTRGYIGDDLI